MGSIGLFAVYFVSADSSCAGVASLPPPRFSTMTAAKINAIPMSFMELAGLAIGQNPQQCPHQRLNGGQNRGPAVAHMAQSPGVEQIRGQGTDQGDAHAPEKTDRVGSHLFRMAPTPQMGRVPRVAKRKV